MFDLAESGDEESEKHEATSALLTLEEWADSKSELTESN